MIKTAGFWVVVLVATIISACGNNNHGKTDATVKKDTLSYTYKIITVNEDKHGDVPDSELSVVKIKYPVFAGENAFNDTIKTKMLAFFAVDDKPDTGFSQMAKNFLTEYGITIPGRFEEIRHSLNISVDSLKQISGLVSMQISGDNYYTGNNVHHEVRTFFINWDSNAARQVTLKDLFNDTSKVQLTKIAETMLRKQESLPDSVSLAKDHRFVDGKFYLSDRFLLKPTGIEFLYNRKSIDQHTGPTDFLVPYSSIKQLLRPYTVISKYIK
jgi:hypothetical protein